MQTHSIKVLAGPSVTLVGSITAASAVVTGLDVASLEGAVRVTGTGIPRGTLVRSFDSSAQITLNRAATATNATASLTFALEPVTVEEAKSHIRLEITDDDAALLVEEAKIASLITASRQLCEGWFSRSLITTSLRLMMPGFGGFGGSFGGYGSRFRWVGDIPERYLAAPGAPIKLPWADVIAVSSLTYLDVNGDTQTLNPANYQVVTGAPSRIWPIYGTSWPSSRWQADSVVIDFTAGYGPTASTVPESTKAGLLLLLGHLYENREGTVTSSIGLKEAPLGVQTLLAMEDWGYRG